MNAIYFTYDRIRKHYHKELQGMSYELKKIERNVYVAIEDIASGHFITEENVRRQQVYSEQDTTFFMSEEDIGKISLVSIPKGVYIQKNMITSKESEDNLREVLYGCIHISSNILVEDYVDIRIFFPNGEDQIVLSKKAVKGLEDDSEKCYLWLDEEEILFMSSAIVDAYLYEGTYLYTTEYIEPAIQEPSVTTYEPNLHTLELIKSNPNIVEQAEEELSIQKRKFFEKRINENRSNLMNDYEPHQENGQVADLTIEDTREQQITQEDFCNE